LSDGTATGSTSRDNHVNLFGGAIVEQPPAFGVVRTTNDANELRDAILGQGILATDNARFTGSAVSAGFFEGGDALFGMSEGILLSTGDVQVANGPNTNDSSTGRASGAGDAELDALLGVTTSDVSRLDFGFMIDPALVSPTPRNF